MSQVSYALYIVSQSLPAFRAVLGPSPDATAPKKQKKAAPSAVEHNTAEQVKFIDHIAYAWLGMLDSHPSLVGGKTAVLPAPATRQQLMRLTARVRSSAHFLAAKSEDEVPPVCSKTKASTQYRVPQLVIRTFDHVMPRPPLFW